MESNLIITCPYNKAHRIAKAKFMHHITKCKENVCTEDFIECPMDKSHIVQSNKLKEHLASCSQLGEVVVDKDPSEKEQTLPTLVGNIESEENWDEEPEAPSYNPTKVSAEKKIVRSMPGLSKSKRLAFRQVERKRLANMEKEEVSFHQPFATKHEIHKAPHLRPPRSTSAVISEPVKKTANTSQVALNKADLSENGFCNRSARLCDSSVQTIDSSFKDESFYSSELHNEFNSEHNIEHNMVKCQNDMISEKSSHFQESCGRDSVIDKKEENLSMFDQSKTDVDEAEKILEAFKNNDSVANTVLNEPLEKSKLLNFLKNAEHLKEINQPVKNVTNHEKTVETSGEMELEWDEMFHKFKRLAYYSVIDKKEENLSMFDQSKTLQTDVDEAEKILEAFKNNDSVANTVLNEPLEKSKLLNFLKNAEHLKEINQSVKDETVTNHEKTAKTSGEIELEWDEMFHKFKRLAYLTDIQNTAATESAQLLLQLKNLKLRQDAKK